MPLFRLMADEARRNDAFQRVVHTGSHCQLVLVALPAGEELGPQTHCEIDQLLTVIEGTAEIESGDMRQVVCPGEVIVLPSGTEHNVINSRDEPLRLISMYTSPAYPDGMTHQSKVDAMAAQEQAEGQPPPEEDLSWVARFDMAEPTAHSTGLEVARRALRRGELAVAPTDTIYGIFADAQRPDAVAAIMKVRHSRENVGVPIFVGSPLDLDSVADGLSDTARALASAFWPGGLTLICRARSTLERKCVGSDGRIAIRIPRHDVALELLKDIGPLAVSGAHRIGMRPPATIDEAISQLGSTISVYLDGGEATGSLRSTIVDVTGSNPLLLRRGVVSEVQLREVATSLICHD